MREDGRGGGYESTATGYHIYEELFLEAEEARAAEQGCSEEKTWERVHALYYQIVAVPHPSNRM